MGTSSHSRGSITRRALAWVALAAGLGLLFCQALPAIKRAANPPRPVVISLGEREVPESTALPAPNGLNLNTATKEELMGLPGIGEVLAELVIAQREIHPFHFVEDLRVVPGFGVRRIAALKGLVYVEPPREPSGN